MRTSVTDCLILRTVEGATDLLAGELGQLPVGPGQAALSCLFWGFK